MSDSNASMFNVQEITPLNFIKSFMTIYENLEPKMVKPIMLWGAPGIGKSDTVKKLCTEIENANGKKVILHDVRLSLYNPTDLKGIPYPDKNTNETIWLKPEIFSMDESDGVINILFFDELTNASPSVAAATYQIVLDRGIATHKIPDNCLIICAGNRAADKSATNKMPAPLANRLVHFEFKSDLSGWIQWASTVEGFDPRVIAYLSANPSQLFGYSAGGEAVAFPTPRSWESVSRLVSGKSGDDLAQLAPWICGNIGTSVGSSFYTFICNAKRMPDMTKIMDGSLEADPDMELDIKFLVCSSIASSINDIAVKSGYRPEGQDLEYVENMLVYTEKLNEKSPDVQTYVMMRIANNIKLVPFLMKLPIFKSWMMANGISGSSVSCIDDFE